MGLQLALSGKKEKYGHYSAYRDRNGILDFRKTPVRVTADARDVTEQMTSKGLLHTLPLPEDVKKTVITVNWSE